MRVRFHRFLLMLLMLVLPLQTFASAFMQGCEPPSYHAVQRQMAMDDATMAGCHESGPSHALPAQHDGKHCGVCALASALPTPLRDSVAIMPALRSFASQPAASFSGFVPDGPERPPRLPLA